MTKAEIKQLDEAEGKEVEVWFNRWKRNDRQPNKTNVVLIFKGSINTRHIGNFMRRWTVFAADGSSISFSNIREITRCMYNRTNKSCEFRIMI